MAENKNIGALWLKDSKSGGKFMSGSVEIEGVKHQIVVFKNTHKVEGSNQPDYKIYPSTPIQGKAAQSVPDIADQEIPF